MVETKAAELDRINSLLRHGNASDALECLADDVAGDLGKNSTSPSLRKLATCGGEFAAYITNNMGHLLLQTRTRVFNSIAAILLFPLAPTAALAGPPATKATCAGIKDAYPIFGTQCEKNYAKIQHAPATSAARLNTFNARKTVLVIFRKAYLCNGLFGATARAQQSFISGEPGHVTALTNLRTTMLTAGDADPGPLPDLKNVSMRKDQCK